MLRMEELRYDISVTSPKIENTQHVLTEIDFYP